MDLHVATRINVMTQSLHTLHEPAWWDESINWQFIDLAAIICYHQETRMLGNV